jgi:ATP-binding cassette subfamily B (MDR/TAP) protein 1
MTNIRTILSLNAVQRMIDEYKAATEDAMTGSISITWVIGCATGAEFAASYIAYIIVTLLGSWLLYSNVQDTGCDPSGTVEGVERCDPAGMDIMGALMGVSFASGILPQVSVAIESLSGARSACYPALVAMSRNVKDSPIDIDIERQENDFEVIDRQSNTLTEQAPLPDYVIDSSSDAGHKPKTISGGIEFVNVNFSYPARKDSRVLSSFSLRVEAGKTVALVGASGSGKSTTLSLLERFYDPSGGSITLDGTDLRLLNVKWLREQIGLVLQEPKLFAKSIRENIAMGRPGATIKDIEEAARMANAYDFIMSFPRAFETQVGEMGAQLSGGQRQRIAIARVLLKNPKILLLDEATSALDSESEVTVQQALDKLLKLTSMTTIVIAHRLSTIRNADLIAVVQDGAVVETGTHDSLLANGGAYYHLVQAQKTKQNVLAEETLKILEDDLQLGGSLDGAFPELEMEESSIDRNVAIRFSEVSFRYPARPEAQVLRNLDLTVWEGETVALVGASGSGKSTVIQLMEGFYRPDSGKIEYCGKDVRNICVRWLRDELGLVSQEATLFEGSIADNIRFGCPGATEEQIIEAAKQANCHNFITEFPYGYETVVKDGGILVSGGQKQRIAIARALIKKPKVLLLDEATSALDSESEKLVQVALEAIMARKDQTCIVIAHRLSTVRDADRIAVIDQGSVIEIGTHEMLMNKPDGKYRRLQAMQDLGSYVKGMDPGRQQDISIVVAENALPSKSVEKEDDAPLTKEEVAANSKRAWLMGASDWPYLVIGTIGALLAGLNFPCMGWVWGKLLAIDIVFRLVRS